MEKAGQCIAKGELSNTDDLTLGAVDMLADAIEALQKQVGYLSKGGRLDLEGATPESRMRAVGEDLDDHDQRLDALEQDLDATKREHYERLGKLEARIDRTDDQGGEDG